MKKSLIYLAMILAMALCAVSCEEKEPEVQPVQLEAPALTIVNSTSSSFTIGWEAVENASSYVYTLNGQQEETTSELSVAYADLTPGEYVLKVKAVASDPELYPDSEWAEITVTLAVNKLTTPTLTVMEQTAASFTVAWEAVENAASYAYIVNDGEENTTSELFFTEEGLSAGEYSVKVKAVASEDGEFTDSDWAEISVVIEEEQVVEKELTGLFSVAEGKQVRFAQGNLQYNAVQDVWRFANNQYDVIGEANDNIGPDYDGWIDLFAYGYSGYDGKEPWEIVMWPEEGLGTNYIDPIAGTNYDWGVYNPISNGGNEAGIWRTPTFNEFYYIFHTRENADKLFAMATVAGVRGVILFPDSFTGVDGINILMATDAGMFKYSDMSYYYTDDTEGVDHYSDNIYDSGQWQKLEDAGAVFFPHCGYRNEGYYQTEPALYWLSQSEMGNEPSYWAGRFNFSQKDVGPGSDVTWIYGQAVRLVKDAE